MATRTITTKLALEGEKEYKAQIQSINAQFQVYKSELAHVEAQYRTNANSLEALTAKEAALSGQQDLLSQRHQAQTEMLKKAKTAQEEYAKQVEELKNRLDGLSDSSGSSAEEQEKLNEELAEAEKHLQMASNSVLEYQKGLNYTERDQANLSAKLEETRKYLDEAKNSADQTAHSMEDFDKVVEQAMSGVNASMREQKSALTLLETAFKGQENTLAALSGKHSVLSNMYDQQKEKIRALEQAVKDAAEACGEADTKTLRYKNDLNLANTELYQIQEELEETAGYLKEAQNSADQTAHSMKGFGSSTEEAGNSVSTLASALQAAGLAMALRKIAQSIMECVDASKEFQSAMAGVQKVTKMSDGDLAVLADQIKQMSTEIPAVPAEIAQVAEASARLGIARENLLDFTRVMIDLGESSDLSSEAAATALARFANVVGTASDDYERLGSVIVALGNNFATSESEITEMSSRLASAGKLAGLTEAQIMALAAAMSSVGIAAEAGGTAMTQTLTAIEKAVTSGGEKLEQFASISGMSASEFAKSWKSDPITAIQAFIAGLGRLDEQGESATQVLEELGLSGIRQSNMLKSLALASETLTGAVDMANQAWAENTELAETAAARYATDAAKMQMAANAAGNLTIAIGDALRPALGDLAEAGTAGFNWAAEFVEENPWLVQALASVTVAVGVTAGGLTAYTLAAKAAQKATDTLNKAMTANPVGVVATAVAAAAIAMTTFAASVDNAVSRSQDLVESLEESKRAYEDSAASIQTNAEQVQASISVLEELAAVEDKTAGQKAALAEMVEQLNQSVPGLTLAYDEQTDSLNLTAEAVRALAQAEAERQQRAADLQRMSELYSEQERLSAQLAEAQEELSGQMANVTQYIGTYGMNVSSLEKSLQDLEAALAENEAEYDALAEKLADANAATVDLTAANEALSASTKALTEEIGLLDTALAEQADSGSLSLETTEKLIDAGYAAAVAIDEETGAVTLDRVAYVELATAKLDDQIASLETQRQAVQNALNLSEEANAAVHDASAYWELARAKIAAADDGDLKSIDAQIAALNKLKASLGSYTNAADTAAGASTAAARASFSASQTMKTQAEKDLAEYKELLAELDHRKNLELVSEREYYQQLKEYRDQYLTDDGNLDEYRKVTEQIFKYDKALVDQEAALWEEQIGNLVGELEDRVKAVQSQQQSMESALAGYGDLFTVKDDKMSLDSLQSQIDAINAYEEALSALKERGISDSLMTEVLGMDVDEATQYAKKLIAMTDSQWDQYNDLWEEKQKRAVEVAEQFFRDQLDTLETEYDSKLAEALDTLTDTSFESGVDTAQGLIDGLASMENALRAQAQAMVDEINQIFASARGIPSNAELGAALNFDAMREPVLATAQDLRETGAAIVNGNRTAAVGAGSGDLTVNMQINGKTLYTETIEDFRAVNRANPEVIDDT